MTASPPRRATAVPASALCVFATEGNKCSPTGTTRGRDQESASITT